MLSMLQFRSLLSVKITVLFHPISYIIRGFFLPYKALPLFNPFSQGLQYENTFKCEYVTSKVIQLWILSFPERLIEIKTVSPRAIALTAAKL